MTLATLYGTGGGRIPLTNGATLTLTLTRRELVDLLDRLPTTVSGALHRAVRQGQIDVAQRIIREAATAYAATTRP